MPQQQVARLTRCLRPLPRPDQYFSWPSEVSVPCLFGVDNLAHGREEADALARAVVEVEQASNDFVGAGLTNARLDGVALEGTLGTLRSCGPRSGNPCVEPHCHATKKKESSSLLPKDPTSRSMRKRK